MRTPCLTDGLRGLSYRITVSEPARDVHSGFFGRTVHEPMTDLIALMTKLADPSGKILIPSIEEMVQTVQPPTQEEISAIPSRSTPIVDCLLQEHLPIT
jgi:Cys-Gly metallodipeptidase DUG1